MDMDEDMIEEIAAVGVSMAAAVLADYLTFDMYPRVLDAATQLTIKMVSAPTEITKSALEHSGDIAQLAPLLAAV